MHACVLAMHAWDRSRHGKFLLDVTCPCMPSFWPLSGSSLVLGVRGQLACDRTCGNFRPIGYNGSNKMSK
jgi:hypothetical protein